VDVQERLRIPGQPLKKQDAAHRTRNWDEVFTGFDFAAAKIEASRCIDCPSAPCQSACPVHNDIPAALKKLEKGDLIGASAVFRQTSELPEVCGRLCPQEKLCEGECVVSFAIRPDGSRHPPVAIGKLESFVTDWQRKLTGLQTPELPSKTGRRVAIIGAGPAGLAVAERLAKNGHTCAVFDAWPEPGGLLLYGIPSFKLAREVVTDKLDFLRRLGVEFITSTWIGRDMEVDELLDELGFDAVFLGTGATIGGRLAIPGENLDGIYQATEFLVRANIPSNQLPPEMQEPLRVGKQVAVIGGGDTSMDCVRTAVRLGAEEVTCVYRRTEAQMPGRGEERQHAREEGVTFRFLTMPLRFIGHRRVSAIQCQKLELIASDGRQTLVPIPGSEFVMEADTVVLALGYAPDPALLRKTRGLTVDERAQILVDAQTGQTSRRGVFAGGDSVNGADLVVTALADGQRAAAAIHDYLSSLPPPRDA
jgi:glutamate synthase (NADPH/NADH) small chain